MRTSRRWLIVTLLIAMVLALAPTALAEADTALGAAPLTSNLRGNPWGGSTDHYLIDYPGGKVPFTLELHPLLLDVVAKRAFGVNLYGPHGDVDFATTTNQGDYVLYYASEHAAVLTVEVYNYSLKTIPYEIRVLGLGSGPDAAPSLIEAPTAPPAPESTEIEAIDAARVVYSGSLVGTSGGHFADYDFYAEAGERVTITMDNAPIDPSFGQPINFRAYGPDGKLAAKGVESPSFHWTDTFVVSQTGEYFLQVHNYAPGVTLDYTLTIERD